MQHNLFFLDHNTVKITPKTKDAITKRFIGGGTSVYPPILMRADKMLVLTL